MRPPTSRPTTRSPASRPTTRATTRPPASTRPAATRPADPPAAAPAPGSACRRSRALAPVAGVLLLALTVVIAAVAAGAVLAVGDTPDGSPPRASLSLAVDGGTLSLTHHGGDTLVVDRLRLVVRVDGEPLVHQPPVPFFSARGFHAGPTGPFNSATDSEWTAGETATLRVAGTNRPQVATGGVVTVTVFVDDARVAELREPVG